MSHCSFAHRSFRVPVVVAFALIAAACSPMTAGATSDEDWSGTSTATGTISTSRPASTMFEGQLIVGATSSGGTALHGVARWGGTGWRPWAPASRAAGTVRSLAVYQGALYANGWRWDGEVWTNTLVVDGQVDCLAVHDGLLVAGGLFTSARGVPADNLLAWDGVDVAELGGGCNNRVQALASDGARLYAGGSFTQAGDVAAPRIACWDGTSWSDLAGGITGTSLVLAIISGRTPTGPRLRSPSPRTGSTSAACSPWREGIPSTPWPAGTGSAGRRFRQVWRARPTGTPGTLAGFSAHVFALAATSGGLVAGRFPGPAQRGPRHRRSGWVALT
ncbi:MAG: hypothetical protein IPH09_09405 [bacterium]|nr:hypothetical protein [bacterium]